ncbi:lysine--tRNA ligase [Buchnera aphidicola (Macrosiphoniella sanborni)]|uniref:Lysine--tRNA ligase n=1 Tax=Buchnera aphidicola (Macrosiphoniella sanborni) TaxID=1241865 RepID=A0A4D6YDE8_9GAMM|nr:lysine--tRNA ligase [Buchnera aphidicola]QCI23954.1 lysine--tRNA ligase [Buchnera aphidicola (Macrosiphoniella sanborni)]
MSNIIKNENNIIKNEIIERKNKFFNMKKQGLVFPDYFKRSGNLKKIYTEYQKKDIYELKKLNIYVSVAGRMIQKRIMGKASFCTLQDIEGKIQIYVKEENITSKFYNDYFKKLDIGDILGVTGLLFKTKTGELSISCDSIKILSKALKPLPDKFHGLLNQEIRYRKRYLDLISNNQLYKIFQFRSNIIAEIRNFMIKKNFLEVETPMLQSIPGGANARPFITYHNEINASMYLRIAPELYLKKLIIGGFERIFELNRNFRNEGVSSRHNPEFTMMEAYIAYSNYQDMMELTESILKNITQSIFKKNKILFHKYEFDFSKPFHRLTMKNAILKFNKNIILSDLTDLKKIKLFAESIGIKIEKKWTIGHIENEIFEKTVEKKLIQPTFITQYPVEVSPLARRNNIDCNTTDRFELFIAGYEIANGFSELNDAEDQKNRFLKQINETNKKENHNIFYDEDYIEALKYGLPPTSGLGIGIDRLIMIFTNQNSIRDVILFPTLRYLNK